MYKFHITGMKPCKICQIKGLNTLIFRGEYGYLYEYNLNSQEIQFISEDIWFGEKDNIGRDIELIENIDLGFCGLALDYTIINKTEVICCSSEGTIHLIERMGKDWVVKSEMRISRDRLVSLEIYKDQIYILSHSGNIYRVSMLELLSKTASICLSSIWDIEADEHYLYCGSADGKLCVYDRNLLELVTSFSTKTGWINSIYKGYCCTSAGNIYRYDIENGLTQIYSTKNKYWFNDLCIVENCIIVVTAEGELLELDFGGNIIGQIKLSNNQLISIDQYNNKIYVASIKGEIFVCDLIGTEIRFLNAYLLDVNVTCIQVFEGNLLVATTKGELGIIKVHKDSDSFQSTLFYAELLFLSKSRIWKVKAVNNYIYTGSVAGEIFRICLDDFCTDVFKTLSEITSIFVDKDSIFIGTRVGKLSLFDKSLYGKKVIVPIRKKVAVSIKRSLDLKKDVCDFQQVKLHIYGGIDFNGRLIKFLKDSQYIFQIIEHEKEDIAVDIEWYKYPYLTFGNRFLASGMLLDEFSKQGVIERLI